MKRKKILARFIFLTLLLQAISFSALSQPFCDVSLSAPPTCVGDTMFVPITFAGWAQPNVAAIDLFVQISDTNIIAYRGNKSIHASFTSPIINTVNAGGTSQNIIYSWSNTTPGTVYSGTLIVYKFLCKSGGSTSLFITGDITNLSGQSYDGSFTPQTAVVNTIPLQPGVITGSTGPLFGSTQAYSIASVSGATSYTWSVPSGGTPAWSINSGQGSTSINTSVGIKSGSIKVTATNACGTGPQRILNVSKTAPATMTIGTASVCAGATAQIPVTFSGLDQPNTGSLDMALLIPDTTIIGYRGFTDLNASFSNPYINCVNSGGNSKTIYFSWTSLTPATDQSGTLIKFLLFAKRKGSQNISFNTADISITDIENNPYSITWNSGSITVDSIPVKPGVISGSVNPQFGSVQIYSIAPVTNATSYTWVLPSGGSPVWNINSGQGSVSLNTTVGINSGLIKVSASNSCGTGQQRTLAVTKYAGASLSIVSSTACLGDTLFVPVTFTGLSQPNTGALEFELLIPDTTIIGFRDVKGIHASFNNPVVNCIPNGGKSRKIIYAWANSTAATIAGGTLIIFKFITKNTGTINLSFGAGTGTAIDIESNAYTTNWNSGSGTISSLPAQPGAISGNMYPFPGISETYSIANVPGATSYVWTLPSGGTPAWTILSGQGTSSITVIPGSTLGDISVIATNTCGSSTATVFSVISSSSCTVSIGNAAVCMGDTAFIPVIFSGWGQPDVGAISFAIRISDTTVLGYRGYKSEHPSFTSPTINYVNPGIGTTGQIWYGWASTTPGNAASDTLVILKLLYKTNGTATLSFLTNVNEEITDGSRPKPRPYTVSWVSGNISIGTVPAITLQPINDTIFTGGVATYNVAASSGSLISYQWQVSDNGGSNWQNASGILYNGVTTTTLSIPGATVGMKGYQYHCLVSNGCGAATSLVAEYKLFNITGAMLYQANIPYSLYHSSKSTKVYLYKSGSTVIVDSASLTNSGYTLSNLQPGYYNLGVKTERSGGGINASDALLISNANIGLASINKMQRRAGETRIAGQMNSSDALNCRKYFVHAINTFPMGNWVFASLEPGIDTTKVCNYSKYGVYTVNHAYNKRITSKDLTLNIGALCVGDVNGSRAATLLKKAIIAENMGEITSTQGVGIDIPVYLNSEVEAGAISLSFQYPEDKISIKEIRIENPLISDDDFMYSVIDGTIYLAWTATSPWTIRSNEPFMIISAVVKNGTQNEEISAIGEIEELEVADMNATKIDDIALRLPMVKVIENTNNSGLSFGVCRPNPVNNISTILYSIPENGHVKIELFNAIGECSAVLHSAYSDKGNYEIELNSDGLAAGIYTCKLSFTTSEKTAAVNKMIVVVK